MLVQHSRRLTALVVSRIHTLASLHAFVGSCASSSCASRTQLRRFASHSQPKHTHRPRLGMSAPSADAQQSQAALDSLRSQITQQGNTVRDLKAAKADKSQITQAVTQLNALKTQLTDAQLKHDATHASTDASSSSDEKTQLKQIRSSLEDLLLRRFFYVPSFEIYGSVGGLYDFGPSGCAVKQNLLAAWRRHFVLEEQMQEVECACMTPEVVLKTSGHVDKFTDLMVRDSVTQDCHRADKLLEEHLDSLLDDKTKPLSTAEREHAMRQRSAAGAMNAQQLDEALAHHKVRAPETNNALTPSFPFNLMFNTQIGPTGKLTGYLRPETAQGIFVNFRRLLDANSGRMPFAAAQVGLAFRNEIAPRAGLLRVREFTLAEIEHFVKPDDKRHARFQEVADVKLSLLTQDAQDGEDKCQSVTTHDAVHKLKMIDNETLAYFMARTQLFLLSVGIRADCLRFRQHLKTEMAHYAQDCWDAEIKGSYGWIECVGHADRSAYDLRVHTEKSKVDLSAQEVYPEPRLVDKAIVTPNAALIGKTFGKQSKPLMEHLKQLERTEALQLRDTLAASPEGKTTIALCTGESYDLTQAMVKIEEAQVKISTQKYTPSVIEPSFGIGRILYHVLEHAYHVRSYTVRGVTEQRVTLRLPFGMAPIKCAILPISSGQAELAKFEHQIARQLTLLGIASRVDASAQSIGRRYARQDEVGTPCAITIDFDTIKDQTVTVRERDSTQQLRCSIQSAIELVQQLCEGTTQWAQAWENSAKYKQVQRSEAE